jgi:AraC family transcriptional regulator
MDEAKRLLRETKQSVVAVAVEVGYPNPSHFAQLFRRQTGLSPSDYRRQRLSAKPRGRPAALASISN